MSRPGPSPPPALTPIASTSTAHLTSGSGYSGVRHRHDKEPMTYPPREVYTPSRSTTRPRRRKRRDGEKKGRRIRWRRGLVTEAFRKFGEHCARNQIRTLLIDCLVMTNLFYPSMVLYLQKKSPQHTPKIPLQGEAGPSTYRQHHREHPFSLLSTPVLDNFFPYPPPLLPRLTWAGWWGRDTGQYEDQDRNWSLSRSLPEGIKDQALNNEEIQILRVAWADVEDVLDRDVEAGERSWEERDHILLRLVRDIAEEWEETYRLNGESCIRQLRSEDGESAQPTGPCYILSPNHDPPDSGIAQTSIRELSAESADSFEDTVFPGETPFGWAANAGNIYHSFGALFRTPRNSTNDFQARWQKSIHQVAKKVEGEVFVEAQAPKITDMDQTGQWYLTYTSSGEITDRDSSSHKSAPLPADHISTSPPRLVLFLYAVLFITLIAQLSNASKVHSRFGLAFTGVVQLCCSSVMSFSVLALLGWNGWGASMKQSSLPTYVLPFVIVVVGAENMSTLTKAIFSIPFTHSVPVRIGLGLSKVGTTIALTSLTDLLVLGVVWLCVNLQPVREFCLFAAVVIITDWFMLHTFFLTVLSIDAQRLELADVLTSNGVPPISPVHQETNPNDQGEGKQSGFNWRKLLRARTTKSGSLVLLLMTVGLLYWLTERHRTSLNSTASLYGYTPSPGTSVISSHSASPTPYITKSTDLSNLAPSARLWRSLNPLGWPYIKILVPPASILVLPRTGHSMRPADIRKLSLPTSRLLLPRLRPLFYLFKVVILPQAVTAGALYALLLYLLKDADLLDAQRNRLGRIDEKELQQGNDTDTSPTSNQHQDHLFKRLKANMLPCSHESDIDLISTSSDGLFTLSVGIDNTICLWRFNDSTSASGTREILSNGNLDPEDPIVASAISEDGRHATICTENGVVRIWEIPPEGQVIALDLRNVKYNSPSKARITAITFDYSNLTKTEDPFTVTPTRSSNKSVKANLTVLVAFTDGAVVSLNSESDSTLIIDAQQSGGHSCVSFIRSQGLLNILIASSTIVQVYRDTSSGWLPTMISDNAEDRITSVSSPEPLLPGLWAIGHKSGTVHIVDEIIGHLLSITPGPGSEPIRKIQLAKPASMRCTGCNVVTTDGYLVISSTGTQIYFDRVSSKTPPTTNNTFCKCSGSRTRTSLDELSRPNLTSQPSPTRTFDGTIGGLVVPPSWIKTRYFSPGTSPRKSPSLLPLPSNGEFPLSSHGGARRLSNLHKPDESMALTSSMDRSSISGGSCLNTNANPSPAGEFEVQSLGSIIISPSSSSSPTFENEDRETNLNWEIVNDNLIGIKKTKQGSIDDSQWSIYLIDLSSIWNGLSLNVNLIELQKLINQTKLQPSDHPSMAGEDQNNISISMKDRRTERIHSLNGRATFPEKVGVGERKSFSVPTFENLGYVEINQFKLFSRANKGSSSSVIGGFGNRLGIIHLHLNEPSSSVLTNGGKQLKYNSDNNNSNNFGLGIGTIINTPTPRRSSSFPLSLPPPPSSSSSTRINGNSIGHKKAD